MVTPCDVARIHDRDHTRIASVPPMSTRTGALRVVTLNAATFFEPDWEARRHELVAWLARLETDVVCLQEIHRVDGGPHTAEWVAEHADGRWWCAFGGVPLPPEMAHGRAVEFGPAVLSRWPIDEQAGFALPVNPRPVKWEAYRFRMGLLHVRTNGIDVFSVHLEPPPDQGAHRCTQARFVADRIEERRDRTSPLPPILCGDFNAEPDSDEIRFLRGLTALGGGNAYFQEAWSAVGRTDPGWTWDNRNPLASRLNVPNKRVDYVFVGDTFLRSGGTGLIASAELAFHEPLTDRLASDHFGVVVDVGWPGRPQRS